MNSEPTSSPSEAPEPRPEKNVPADVGVATPRLSPKGAILKAAIVTLENARQYLDKFLNWPDYILATHYYGAVLALSDPAENHIEAEKCFKDVDSWLLPAGEKRRYDDARKRIRVEAIYNRAVLLAKRERVSEAREELLSVINLVGSDRSVPPRGVRFAAEFALIMIDAQTVKNGLEQGLQAETKQLASLKNVLSQSMPLFLENTTGEIQRLQGEIDSADKSATEVKAKMDMFKDKEENPKSNSLSSPNNAEQKSVMTADLIALQSRITKASKDLAILRVMESKVQQLQDELFSWKKSQ